MGNWLPEGHAFDLHVEHKPLPDAGDFTGGGNKGIVHTTESNWSQVDDMYRVLRDKNAAPHVILGGRPGLTHPVAIQCVAFNQAARALANDSGDFHQTNRSDCIQIEICWRAGAAALLTEWHYKAFANLIRLINVEVPDGREIPRVVPRAFSNATRFSDRGFEEARGWIAHAQVPDNDHWDPGPRFRMDHVIDLLEDMPSGGYDL